MGPKSRRKSHRRPGARRRARELALAALYRADLLGLDEATAIASLPGVLAVSIEDWAPADRGLRELREEALAYASRIVAGVYGDRTAIDGAIDELASEWRIERLAMTDRSVLRMAMWELSEGAAPAAALINEAVELAKQYGGAESAGFVNGVLAARLASQQTSDEA